MALNSAMDGMTASLVTTSEKSPEPLLVSVLAGEAMLQKISDGSLLLTSKLTAASSSGMKRTSIWSSDKLLTITTLTVRYALMDSLGIIRAAGVVNSDSGPQPVSLKP